MYYDYTRYFQQLVQLLTDIKDLLNQWFPTLSAHADKIFFLVEVILVIKVIDMFTKIGRYK